MEQKAPTIIKQWLSAEGRKAAWIAAKTGATPQMLSGWLNGKAVPIALYRAKLAEVTGLDVEPVEKWQ